MGMGCLYRWGVKNGPALFLQQRGIVFQVIDALLSFQTPPVPGNTLSPKVKGDRFRAGSDGYLLPTVGSRDGVVICIKTNGTEPVYPASGTLAGFVCTPYRYKFPVGARDLFSSLEPVSSIPNNLSTFLLVRGNFPNFQKRLIELFPPVN